MPRVRAAVLLAWLVLALGGVAQGAALLQKPPVIWYKGQFAVDPRSLETCHERSLPI